MVPNKGHYRLLARSIRNGLVVPFLGAGVNLCDRPSDQKFRQGEYLPSGAELADYLAREFYYEQDDHPDLLRVSQYVSLKIGVPELYFALHKVFDGDYQPSKAHRFLATMPPGEGERGEQVHPLIVTTNYDDALETAFDEIGRPYDLVYYVADADDGTRGKFVHVPPGGSKPVPIEVPNEYLDVGSDQRAVIVKVHGMVNRDDQQRDSYVITEDHYIDYLAQTDINRLLPAKLVARLRHQRTQLLFLGYGLRDWNLRVILHRIWGSRQLRNSSVAIQRETDDIEAGCWAKRGVQIFDLPLDEYIGELDAELDAQVALRPAS